VVPAAAGAGPPNALLTQATVRLPGPPNGDLALGLEGWQPLGRSAVLGTGAGGGPVVTLRENTSLVSPPFTVPPGGQVLVVRARAASGGVLLAVRARPEDGGPEVVLGEVEPGPAMAPLRLPLPGLEGRAVRIVLDPVAGLGRGVEVGGIGPVEAPVPGWALEAGLPVVGPSAGRRALLAADGPLALRSAPFRPGPGARSLLVRLRGEGLLRADAGAGAVVTRAAAAWRDVRVPVPATGDVRLALRAEPGDGGLALAGLGEVVRAVALTRVRASRAGRGAVVAAVAGPGARGLVVRVRVGGRVAGRGRVDAGGRVAVAVAASGRRGALEVVGDRTRIGTRAAVAIPGPRRRAGA
jgi:hypothetical protein